MDGDHKINIANLDGILCAALPKLERIIPTLLQEPYRAIYALISQAI